MKKVDTYPTKEEIKAARAVMRKVFAARRKKYVASHRRHRSPADRDFYMWTHDMRVVLAAAARDVTLTPTIVAQRAQLAADEMAQLIAGRRPEVDEERPRRLSRQMPAVRLWRIWQEMLDGMIHEMAAKSELAPHVIVDRARRIADAAMPHIKKRYKR